MLRVLAVLALLLGLPALAFWRGWVPAPYNPFRPLDVAAPLTVVTPLKLRLLESRPALCRAALAHLAFATRPVPDTHPAPGCGLTEAVRLSQGESPVALDPSSFLASCPLAVEWALFTRQVVEPAAETAFGQRVAALHHLGSYNCRNVRDGQDRSAHATAEAIDFSGVTLASGRKLMVKDWSKGGEDGAFLHRLRNGACRIFGLVLSPDFNADHASHLHLQATGWGFCH
ncbi:extensin-like domain-containing protein [Acidisoma sp. 7E03]